MKLQKKTAHKNEPAPCIVNALPESIDSDKEKKIFTVEKASEIYVNNSKGTDVAWKAIHKQQKTKSCLFKPRLTIALIFWPYWHSFCKLKQLGRLLSHVIFRK